MSLFFANTIFLILILILILVASLQWISQQQRYLLFLVERVEFENSCVFSLFGKNIEYSFKRVSSREGHEVSNITLNQSLNSAANQLDIFQFAANPN